MGWTAQTSVRVVASSHPGEDIPPWLAENNDEVVLLARSKPDIEYAYVQESAQGSPSAPLGRLRHPGPVCLSVPLFCLPL